MENVFIITTNHGIAITFNQLEAGQIKTFGGGKDLQALQCEDDHEEHFNNLLFIKYLAKHIETFITEGNKPNADVAALSKVMALLVDRRVNLMEQTELEAK